MAASKARTLWLRWIWANAIAELIGLGGTFTIGATLFSSIAERPGIAADFITTAGLMALPEALEGAIVGLAQWSVLRTTANSSTKLGGGIGKFSIFSRSYRPRGRWFTSLTGQIGIVL